MIDGWTISLASALIVVVTATLFVGGTIVHKDSSAGRLWAAGYLAGILTTTSYLAWQLSPELWWASAVGNAGFVAGTAFFWLGCRRHNGRRGPNWAATVGSFVVLVAGLIPGPDSDEWAGAQVYFAAIVLFAVLSAVECSRGEMRRARGSRPMFVVFSVQAAFFAGRLVFFTVGGPDSDVFSLFFGSSALALVTMLMSVVLFNSMSLIRFAQGAVAESAPRAGRRTDGHSCYTVDDVLTAGAFGRIVGDWLDRSEYHDEQLALLHIDLDDLREINTAFGPAHSNAILARYTAVVRQFGPPHAAIGSTGTGRLSLIAPVASSEGARAIAQTLQSGLLEDSLAEFAGLRPTISIGIALTDYTGFDFERLDRAARSACKRASDAGGNRVVFDAGAVPATVDGSGQR
ncbi:diguanylate cyclase domain-containing protein [Microterricola viridarii]|uniref:Diguanylate cyclase (GGDEF) domain-containing protein n=1 Tax=Microterricola viridarii TaxID=412690 RepID=A0A1H1Z380_9MICO|nr:diguanylate cyclase [Microterricola viridarii]SDT28059.1 diguanylate cyclase (GGDEF) domain-containing protein [Microterricola viridarii]